MYDLWKALITEFLGTFTLIFIGASSVALAVEQGGSVVGTALAFGLIYMALIYVWNSYSGANFNPAISFGLALTGRLGWCRMLLYWIVQFLGALAAGGLVAWIYGVDLNNIGELSYSQPWKVVVLEMFLTFFLVITFLFMTRNPMVSIISGFVIGAVLIADILVGGYLAKVGVNPAYALAAGIISGNWANIWVYIVGPLFGALLAALVYKAFTMPWTCSEIVHKGCDQLCGEPVFHAQWKDCADHHMMKAVEVNKVEFDLKPKCDIELPCGKPKCDLPKFEKIGRKSYKFTGL
jgi:aquaporin NIP